MRLDSESLGVRPLKGIDGITAVFPRDILLDRFDNTIGAIEQDDRTNAREPSQLLAQQVLSHLEWLNAHPILAESPDYLEEIERISETLPWVEEYAIPELELSLD